MTSRERFFNTMRYEAVDYRPIHTVGVWPDTLARWHSEGLPRDIEDVNAYLGITPLKVRNISGNTGLYPAVETRIIQEDDDSVISIDQYGRTIRTFTAHTSMPEWLDFPVKTPDDLRRVLDEHYQIDDLNDRFPAEWEEQVRQASNDAEALILIDGGCYYWTLRELAGVEYASYLLHDAPELVDELIERYHTVVMEGIRRAVKLTRIDLIGFGEDLAFKTGPLISPAMFRQFLLPRYTKVMELAHAHAVEFTWFDSDGDLRQFIPDLLAAGVNALAPCEVAANMVPVELRKQFGRELRLFGGIDKREIAKDHAAIDAEIARNRALIEDGGYFPAIDHSVPADISWDNYRYFIEKLRNALGMLDN